MEAGEIRLMDPEALAYALIGIGHFLALRWLIWPQENRFQEEPFAGVGASQAEGQLPEMPERVMAALFEFLKHGMQP